MNDFSGPGLLALREKFPTTQALADHLGLPRTTVRDRLREADEVSPGPIPEPVEIPVIHRDYSNQEKLHLYPFGDLHIGSPMHNGPLWANWLAYMIDAEHSSMQGIGDMLNSAVIGSKSDVYDETMTVGEAKRLLRRQLEPLSDAGRLDLLCPGNHENRITRLTGDCPIRDVCDVLSVPYVEASALVVYHVGDQEYSCYTRHGTGNGQSLTTLDRARLIIQADLYLTGHVHNQAVRRGDHFVYNGDRVLRKTWRAVSSGSLQGYERYAAERGYPPGALGAPRIHLDGRKHDFHVSL